MTGQMNHQTADLKVNASVFLLFFNAHFLKSISASRTNGTFAFALKHKADPSAKAKEPFFANRTYQYDKKGNDIFKKEIQKDGIANAMPLIAF